jgi:hypothetical protein
VKRHVFEYALLRVVPRVERGESMNAGVVVYCRGLDYLGAKVHLDADRLRALDPGADPVAVRRVLESAASACDLEEGAAGPDQPRHEELRRAFRWLTAPRSTVVQPGPVHTGLTSDPAAELDRLLGLLVLPVPS